MAARGLMDERGLDALLVFGNSGVNRHNNVNPFWLTQYLDLHHNYVIVPREGGVELFVGLVNHVPNAREEADAARVEWGGYQPGETVAHHTGAASLEEAREKAGELDLADAAPRIDQPLLVITGKLDRLIPWQQSEQIAKAAQNATWVLFEEANHVCNNIPYKYRPLTADWLREHLT